MNLGVTCEDMVGDHRKKHRRKIRFSEIVAIPSYGLIVYNTSIEGSIKFLIYQRRDSYEYIDVLRGAYSDYQLPMLFSRMTEEERTRISTYTFDELLIDVRMGRDGGYFFDCEDRARKKFESIRYRIPQLIETTECIVHELCWGFPKGKKNIGETDIEAATREFAEETKFPMDDIEIVSSVPFIESFRGSNNKYYSTHYFLARSKRLLPIVKIKTPNCIRTECVSEECSDLSWVTFVEAKEKLDDEKIRLLTEVLDYIN